MTRLWTSVPAALVIVVVIVGCTPEPGSPELAETTGTPAGAASCTPLTAVPPGAESLLLWVERSGAHGPPRDWTAVWELAAYADGTVIRTIDYDVDENPLVRTTVDHVDSCAVRDSVAALRALARSPVDLPLSTDKNTVAITTRDAPLRPETVQRIYGLGEEGRDLDYLDVRDHQPWLDARANREAILTQLSGLRADPQRTVPERIRLIELGGDPYGYEPPTLRWPLESLDEVMSRRAAVLACGEVTGAEAAALVDALGNAPAASRWSDPYRTTMVAVAPLMPGQRGCPS